MSIFRKTTDGITAKLQRVVQELHAHAEASLDEADRHFALSTEHQMHEFNHRLEADKARRVADKLGALLE